MPGDHWLGPHHPERDDVVQLAMIELAGAIGRYRRECSLDRWTRALTASVVYKHLRRRKSERTIASSDSAGPSWEGHRSFRAHRDASLRGIAQRVCAHLERIDGAAACTFVLHDIAGYDALEIADMTGVSVADVQIRLARGRCEIRERIASDPELIELLAPEKAALFPPPRILGDSEPRPG